MTDQDKKTRKKGGGRKPLPPEQRRKMVSAKISPESVRKVEEIREILKDKAPSLGAMFDNAIDQAHAIAMEEKGA